MKKRLTFLFSYLTFFFLSYFLAELMKLTSCLIILIDSTFDLCLSFHSLFANTHKHSVLDNFFFCDRTTVLLPSLLTFHPFIVSQVDSATTEKNEEREREKDRTKKKSVGKLIVIYQSYSYFSIE